MTLAKDGYGSKWVDCQLGMGNPLQFRLLSDGLLGYMWPKWIRAGEKSEIRIHSTEQCQLTLWRYGQKKEYTRMVSWFDEHGPRAVAQTPARRRLHANRRELEQAWIRGAASAAIPGSARPIGTLLLVAAHSVWSNLLFSLGGGPGQAKGTFGSAGVYQHLERV